MSPVCVKCRCEMRVKKNDFCVEEMSNADRPYRLWFTDLWHCLSCGAEIVIGFAREPWGEHFQPDYQNKARLAELRYWPTTGMVPAEIAK